MLVCSDGSEAASSSESPPIPGFLVQAILRVVREEGIDLPASHARGLPATAEPAGFSLPGSELCSLLRALAAAPGHGAVGLSIGQRITEPNLHVFGPVITASRTMREAFEHCVALCSAMRYAPNGRLDLLAHEARYVIDETRFGPVWEDIMVALSFHATERFFASMHAGPELHATALFARPAPQDPSAYRRCFGERVRFDADVTGCAFPVSLLDLPRPGTDAALATELRLLGARRLQPMPDANTWSARLAEVLREVGDLSRVDFDKLAARWGLSRRTLRRRLAAEGTSPVGVLEATRYQRALFYLQKTDASVSEIAEMLGYSEPTSFRRAFKRWSGTSPSAHRDRARAEV